MMTQRLLGSITLFSALGCGLAAGAFFAFSTLVIKALSRLPPAQGIAAMQSINVTAINPWFLGGLFAPAAGCALLAALAALSWHEPGAGLRLAGGLIYLAGAIGVTAAANVPMNDALATLAPDAADAAARWSRYVVDWTAWNHVRAATSLAAALLLTLALLTGARP
jgi:uncharacterized membrane protein